MSYVAEHKGDTYYDNELIDRLARTSTVTCGCLNVRWVGSRRPVSWPQFSEVPERGGESSDLECAKTPKYMGRKASIKQADAFHGWEGKVFEARPLGGAENSVGSFGASP